MIPLIIIEGARGAGKTTLVNRLADLLPAEKICGFRTKREAMSVNGEAAAYIHPASSPVLAAR